MGINRSAILCELVLKFLDLVDTLAFVLEFVTKEDPCFQDFLYLFLFRFAHPFVSRHKTSSVRRCPPRHRAQTDVFQCERNPRLGVLSDARHACRSLSVILQAKASRYIRSASSLPSFLGLFSTGRVTVSAASASIGMSDSGTPSSERNEGIPMSEQSVRTASTAAAAAHRVGSPSTGSPMLRAIRANCLSAAGRLNSIT